jgi:hypothetical protein
MAAVIAVAGVAQAQTQTQTPASPAKKELIAKVVQLQQPGVEGLARNLAEQPAVQLMQQVGPAIQRLPAERREAVARDVEADLRKYADETAPIVRDKAVKLAPSTIGVLLDERFSEEELRQIITLLELPVNKKFQSMFPEMQKALAEKLVAETRGEVEVKLRALQSSVAARLGVAPGGGATSAPAAKGAAPASPTKK